MPQKFHKDIHKKILHSFVYAFEGIKILLKEEHNYVFHTFASIIAIILGFIYKLSSIEWCIVILTIGFVIVTETLNTSIENIMDFVCPDKNRIVKKIKDLSAAAVFVSAVSAFVVGLIIYLPKILA